MEPSWENRRNNMGIRNKVTNKGWISEDVTGTAVELDMGAATVTTPTLNKVQVVVSGAAQTAGAPAILLAGARVHVTAALPAISNAIVGRTFMIVTTGSNPTLLTASNAINHGLWTRTLFTPNAIVSCVAATTDFGFTWLASSGSAI